MGNLGKYRSVKAGALRATSLSTTFTLLLAILLVMALMLLQIGTASAAGTLTVEIIAGYNLVVDSNVSSPSTYAPSVATVMGRFCNTGDVSLTNVQGYIGNYIDGINDTPGIYPSRNSATFLTTDPLYNTGTYAFTHVGGSLGTDDATRFIGTLAPGECKVQYWHFSYPQCSNSEAPPCSGTPVWGDSIKPDDDLWLEFDIWGTSAEGSNNNANWTMTMRNEISALANKIEPNPDGRWFNTKSTIVAPGDVITSNGVHYEFGNVRFGFDNDGDFVPDYNAWAQPVGDTDYDPSCFRLVRTSGVLTVTRGSGNPDLIIPFDDNDPPHPNYGGPLYFTDLPSDNTGVTGNVFYTFLALDGPCSAALSPYQEVASGYDNEKFNGDYGAGVPPVGSSEPMVTIDKSSSPDTIPLGNSVTYQIPFANTGSADAGLGLSTGGSTPVVIEDTVPDGTQYMGGSATYSLSYIPNTGVTTRYSIDSGQTWSTSDPGTRTSTAPNNLVVIQWWLNDALPAGSTGNYAQFQMAVPGTYGGSPFIENCAEASFGAGAPFAEACAITLIEGDNSIGDFVWRDEDNNGNQTGETSFGIAGVTVSLYWDRNNNNELDSEDRLIRTQDTSGTNEPNYDFTLLPDGPYLVQVDTDDVLALHPGYLPTTLTIYDVDVSGGQDYNDADFGFGPILSLDKELTSGNPSYEGDQVIFTIDLTNNREGTGEAPYCVYDAWARRDDDTAPDNHSGTGGPKAWTEPGNAMGGTAEPDNAYARADFASGADNIIAGTDFDVNAGGGIIKVEALYRIYLDASLTDDYATLYVWSGPTMLGTVNLTTAELNAFAPGIGNVGWLTWDVTSLRDWSWADFTTGSGLDLGFENRKSAAADASVVRMDTLGFRITTNQMCGSMSDIIDPLPLTDTFDPAKLEFLSADPPVDSSTPAGTLTWDNLGPLYAGQTKQVTVVFKALEPPDSDEPPDGEADPTTHQNCAESTGGTTADGIDINDPSDCVTHDINPAGTIGDFVWNDIVGDGTYDADGADNIPGTPDDEKGISRVTVNLYNCGSNGTCEGGGGDDTFVATTTTDSTGWYLFEGLVDGTYVSIVDTTTLPNGGNGASNTHDRDLDKNSDSGPITINNNDGSSANDDVLDADFGYTLPSMIEGTIWHDRNKSGTSTPDIGEDWLAGITVMLDDGVCDVTRSGGTADDCLVTTTDANGYYLFTETSDGAGGTTPLTGGTYRIVVDPDDNSTPTGYSDALDTWTQSFDTDGTGSAEDVTLTIVTGGLGQADFSYYRPGTSIVGDTVYVDWDGNGQQGDGNPGNGDEGEEGIANVEVLLYMDSDGSGDLDTSKDTLIATTQTEGDSGSNWKGYYEFTGLQSGDYFVVVSGSDIPGNYAQTQDPDESGACTTCDDQSTVEAVDGTSSYLDEDFGYQPTGSGSIGDYVWKDDDGDGIQDPGETGIANIGVSLYWDRLDNGVIDADDPLVAVLTTDANGYYLFDRLPAGNYLVDVEATDIDLPTDGNGDPYVLSTDNDPHDVALSAGQSYLRADFGFTTGGVIGDYIWQDSNGDGIQDVAEVGISNVTVYLCATSPCASGNAIATATTDSNGLYEFTGLPAGDYVVAVDTTTLPTGYTQTGDPDLTSPCSGGTCDSQSSLDLYPGQIDRSRDFGYQPPGVIGDVLWIDANGDGLKGDDETGIPYITVELDNGACTVGSDCPTTETDSDGYYYFGGLDTSNQAYTVIVHDYNHATHDLDFPSGLTLTYDPDETNPCTVCNSQGNTTLTTAAPKDLTVDFGYRYVGTYSISGHVFFDSGNDGGLYTSPPDSPYENIAVYLWNSSNQLIATTTTAADGSFIFSDLPNGTYTVSIDSNAPELESTVPTATPAEPGVKCSTCNNYNTVSISGSNVGDQDFGFWLAPTAVKLVSFTATPADSAILLEWQTATELDNLGFNLYRSDSPGGEWLRLNENLIPSQAPGSPVSAAYTFLDEAASPGITTYYWLEDIDLYGITTIHGPVSAVVHTTRAHRIYLPLVGK